MSVKKTKKQIIQNQIQKFEEKRSEKFKPKQKTQIESEECSDFYSDLINIYSTSRSLCLSLKIIPHVFSSLVSILEEVDLHSRGKHSYFYSIESKILLLLLYLQTGSAFFITTLTNGHIKTTEQVLRSVKRVIELIKEPLLNELIVFKNEEFEEDYAAIIDCTVIRRFRPLKTFAESKIWYSGKSNTYCFKKEVIVNALSGTACYISNYRPGSVHDMVILRETSDDINDMLGDKKLLSDKGYVGGSGYVRNLVIPSDCPSDTQIKKQRSLVERFFGRLKLRFNVLNSVFPLSEELFDDVFNICCCLLNLELSEMPLNEKDEEINEVFNNNLLIEHQERKEKKRKANKKSREGKKKRFDNLMK